MRTIPSIKVESLNLYPSLSYDEDTLISFFEHVCSLHQHTLSGVLSVAFLGKDDLSKIHGEFLNDYRPTDVITFPPDEENEMVGEICVSVDRARDEAIQRNIPLSEELSLYLIHGWLHLLGFDDHEKNDSDIMRREEAKAMKAIGEIDLWPDFLLAPNGEEH